MHTYSFKHLALVLGLLQSLGPFGIDMYLPGLTAIGRDLGATSASVQASLMAFFLALGIGPLFYGPWTDRMGRKTPLLTGLLLFFVAGFGCVFATDMETLTALRFFQGLGACAAVSIPRSMVRDLYTGHEAAKLMGMLMLVFSVGPILAPILGSLLMEVVGWRGIFVFLSLLGVVAWCLAALQIQETWTIQMRQAVTNPKIWANYAQLLRDKQYLGIVLIGGLVMGSFMVYLNHVSFVLMDDLALTPRWFSLMFALNAVAFVGGSQLCNLMMRRMAAGRLIRIGSSALAVSMAAIVAWTAQNGLPNLLGLQGALLVALIAMGMMMPSVSVMALAGHGDRAGTASALMGTLHFSVAAMVMAMIGWSGMDHVLGMSVAMSACGIAACVLSFKVLPRK